MGCQTLSGKDQHLHKAPNKIYPLQPERLFIWFKPQLSYSKSNNLVQKPIVFHWISMLLKHAINKI